ncbi:OmpA family protein [bacterium]|nr:OmpA family protein [bacterium]MBU1637919.1 OmpA family protein [bacterium]MBU1919243.1 OmpA family protein [bacterium]
MADLGNQPPIIRIVKKGGHGGHHGGAWKVAFADFMTAMLALFIVLWVLNQSEDVKRGVGGYFRDPLGRALLGKGPEHYQDSGKDNVLGPKLVAVPSIFKRLATTQADLEREANRLKEIIEQNPALTELGDQISVEVTKEGIRIEISENDKSTIFELGSSRLTPRLISALEVLAHEFSKTRAPVVIEGHTDSKPYTSASGMSNWELSTQRANEARKVLEGSGLPSEQVFMIRGYADRDPIADDPADPRNRRISMLLMSSQGLEMSLGTMTENEARQPGYDVEATPAETESGQVVEEIKPVLEFSEPVPSTIDVATREKH